MSAYICSDRHTSAIVYSAFAIDAKAMLEICTSVLGATDDEMIDIHTRNPDGLTSLMGRAWACVKNENIKSVNHRYDESTPLVRPEALPKSEVTIVDPLTLHALIRCVNYQSCEHPEWERSAARRLLHRITAEIAPPPSTPAQKCAYEQLPWSID